MTNTELHRSNLRAAGQRPGCLAYALLLGAVLALLALPGLAMSACALILSR